MKLPRHTIQVTINRHTYEEEVEPRLLLCYFLRETVGLTGTHVGCAVGECGACSILVNGRLVKSCQMLAVQVDGKEILTVEGLAEGGRLHTVQEAFMRHYALQCGYCTPGMIVASCYLLSQNPSPTDQEIRRRLAGNLCMCTGYAQIVEAVKSAAKSLRND